MLAAVVEADVESICTGGRIRNRHEGSSLDTPIVRFRKSQVMAISEESEAKLAKFLHQGGLQCEVDGNVQADASAKRGARRPTAGAAGTCSPKRAGLHI